MQLSPTDMRGITDILTRLYKEIRGIEEPYGLRFGNGDLRPRIDYFHDAVRALTDGDPRHRESGGRLTLELLAYDAATLRYLHAMPLSIPGNPHGPRSPSTAVSSGDTSSGARPTREAKRELAELYGQYGVLFVALFKPNADNDYQERSDAMGEAVQQLAEIIQQLERGGSAAELENIIAHIDEPKLREALQAMLRNKKKQELISAVTGGIRQVDKHIHALEESHEQYAMAQLALFEEGKDIVKKLGAKGMNLAGQFVQNAMKESTQQRGR